MDHENVMTAMFGASAGLHAQDFTGDPVAVVHLPVRVP
jgi:hypothetical protein